MRNLIILFLKLCLTDSVLWCFMFQEMIYCILIFMRKASMELSTECNEKHAGAKNESEEQKGSQTIGREPRTSQEVSWDCSWWEK